LIDINNFYVLDLHNIGEQCYRILKDGGVLCMIIQDGTKNFSKSCTTYRTIVDYVDNIGFKLFENCIYNRDGNPGGWWNKRFRVDHEYILIFFKGKKPKYFNKEPLKIPTKHKGKKWKGTDRCTDGSFKQTEGKVAEMKCRGTVWKYATSNSERNKIKLKHPATFPDKLAEDLIICFSQENDIVYDPMCGSGTTCIMAYKNKRNFIGSDISEEYINNIAKERLKELNYTKDVVNI
jgi:DNA modification methylase